MSNCKYLDTRAISSVCEPWFCNAAQLMTELCSSRPTIEQRETEKEEGGQEVKGMTIFTYGSLFHSVMRGASMHTVSPCDTDYTGLLCAFINCKGHFWGLLAYMQILYNEAGGTALCCLC